MLYHAKEQKLILPEMQMDYITFGTGKKALIMIQGLNTRGIKGAAISLAYMYRIFAKEYKVYLFDRKENLSKDTTVESLAADLAKAMDTLQISSADVFGVSQGGMIAQYLALNRPDLVKRLVLAVTISRNNATVESVVNHWIEMTEEKEWKKLVEDMAYKLYSEEYVNKYKPLLPLLSILQKPKDVERFLILAKACLTCDTYAKLHQIQCPVLVIGGGCDKVVTGEASVEIAEKLGCEIYLYEGLGHAAYEEAKDFNERILAFLKGEEQ